MDPYKAQVIIELVAIENVTPSEVEVSDDEGSETWTAAQKRDLKIRRGLVVSYFGLV